MGFTRWIFGQLTLSRAFVFYCQRHCLSFLNLKTLEACTIQYQNVLSLFQLFNRIFICPLIRKKICSLAYYSMQWRNFRIKVYLRFINGFISSLFLWLIVDEPYKYIFWAPIDYYFVSRYFFHYWVIFLFCYVCIVDYARALDITCPAHDRSSIWWYRCSHTGGGFEKVFFPC